MNRLKDKVVLMTGAASVPGLGSATAERLGEEGATVYVSDVDLTGVERVATAIRGNGGISMPPRITHRPVAGNRFRERA